MFFFQEFFELAKETSMKKRQREDKKDGSASDGETPSSEKTARKKPRVGNEEGKN